MANEITLQAYLAVESGRVSLKRAWGTQSITQTGTTGARVAPALMKLTTSYAALSKGDVGDLGIVGLRNLNAAGGTNILISLDGGTTDNLLLKPGEVSVFRLPTAYDITDVQAKASATTAILEVTILED